MSRRLSRKPLKKILYTTDLSPNSVYVLRYAIIAAQKHGDRLIVLHVLEDLPPTALALSFAYLDDENYFNITHRKTIHAKQRILKRLQIVCDRELNGDPEAEEMVESIEVDEFNCDLIIMGAHGKGFLRHPYFGSTSKKVVRRARKPVFFVPMPAGDTDLSIHDQ
jgi:nucleotide-binding universal stress UspA family protein